MGAFYRKAIDNSQGEAASERSFKILANK